MCLLLLPSRTVSRAPPTQSSNKRGASRSTAARRLGSIKGLCPALLSAQTGHPHAAHRLVAQPCVSLAAQYRTWCHQTLQMEWQSSAVRCLPSIRALVATALLIVTLATTAAHQFPCYYCCSPVPLLLLPCCPSRCLAYRHIAGCHFQFAPTLHT